jgi:MYXO-CTERM domain-containing protein
MSHGCGSGCVGTDDPYFTGWPSTMIDVSAIQNRAMEWVSFNMDVTGELYFETSHLLASAWDQQCDFSGNGDGTLFYPGTPDRIGGTTHIPIESIRLKLVREGMEDYEYLHLLCTLGDCETARAESSALFPAPYKAAVAAPEDLYAARARLADRIEALGGGPGGVDGGPGEDSDPEEPSMSGGCGCRAGSGGGSLAGMLLVAGALAVRRRRR